MGAGAGGEPQQDASLSRWAINPVGIGIAALGALAMLIAVFLPLAEMSAFSFRGIQQNTLIQSGDGWIFIGLTIGVLGAVYRSYSQGVKSWIVPILGVVAIGVAIYDGSSGLDLYRIDPSTGEIDTSQPVTSSPGVGVYLAGVGGLLALVGGITMRRDATPIASAPAQAAAPPPPPPPPTSPAAPPAAPGWYPDPFNESPLRWWDGERWTDHRS